MKLKEEIIKIAKEMCSRNDSECAVFISGFVKGWEECEKELGYGQDSETN